MKDQFRRVLNLFLRYLKMLHFRYLPSWTWEICEFASEMICSTGKLFDNFVQHSYSPLKRANTYTLIMTMNTPSLVCSNKEAWYKAIYPGTQFCNMLCISSTCH